jgi:hypothetical protein
MEEIQTRDGMIPNASFSDSLIPDRARHPADRPELEDPEPDIPTA